MEARPLTECRNWPETLHWASFKGVRFEVRRDTRAVGRKVVTHDYANGEFWDNEDTGRLPSTIQVEGYVYGDDADRRSNALLATLSVGGPGLLTLPGRKPIIARIREGFSVYDESKLGMYTFDMEFIVEASGVGGIINKILLAGAVATAAVAGIDAVILLFDRQFNSVMRRFSPAQPVPSVARNRSAITIVKVADELGKLRRSVVSSSGKATTKLEYALRRMKENATILAYQGQRPNRGVRLAFVQEQTTQTSSFARDSADAIGLIADNASDPIDASRALKLITEFTAPPIETSIDTLSVRAESGLSSEISALVRRSALVYQAKLLTSRPFVSKVDAVSMRADVAVAFVNEMATLDDPETEIAMIKVRNTAMNYLTRTFIDKPPVVILDNQMSVSAAELATTLYNDASKDEELMLRNRAQHPLFLPPRLEVLATWKVRDGL